MFIAEAGGAAIALPPCAEAPPACAEAPPDPIAPVSEGCDIEESELADGDVDEVVSDPLEGAMLSPPVLGVVEWPDDIVLSPGVVAVLEGVGLELVERESVELEVVPAELVPVEPVELESIGLEPVPVEPWSFIDPLDCA